MPNAFAALAAHCRELATAVEDWNYDDMSGTQVAACTLALRKLLETAMLCDAIAAEYQEDTTAE